MVRNLFFSIIIFTISLALVFIYVRVVHTLGNLFWPHNAQGRLIYDSVNNIRGSELLAQQYSSNTYFKSRGNYEGVNICNLAIYNDDFTKFFAPIYANAQNDISFITPSASQLDPYIMVNDAKKQAIVIAKSRKINLKLVEDLIDKLSLKKTKFFFELEIINTTLLNHELDSLR